MSTNVDLGKLILGILTFIVTFFINEKLKKLNELDKQLKEIAEDLAELRGSISGRFVIRDDHSKS